MFLNNFTQLLIFLFIAFIAIKYFNKQTLPSSKKYDDAILSKYTNVLSNPSNFTNKEILNLGQSFNQGNSNIKISYKNARDLYLLALKNGDKTANIHLGNLYYDGIKNQLEPNAEKALFFYNNAINSGYSNCLLDVGDIYMYGFREVEPDLNIANECYKKLLKIGSYEYRLSAYDRLLQLYDETTTENKSLNLQDYYNSNKKKWDYVDNIQGSNYIKGSAVLKPKDNYNRFIDNKNNQTNNFWDNINLENIDVNKDAQPKTTLSTIPNIDFPLQDGNEPPIINTIITRNDRQNVHDHVVSKTVKKSAVKLKEKTKITKDIPTTIKEVRSHINTINDEKKKENAIKTLDTIEKKNQSFTSIDMSELDALQLVWNRINDPINNENVNNLKDNLMHELNDCNEERGQVCATGRLSRIIDTLNKTDKENIVEIIPKNALNQELMSKAANIREKMIKNEPQNVQNALNSIKNNESDEQLIQNFDIKFKKELLDTYKKEYVDENVISEEILNTEVNKWIDSI